MALVMRYQWEAYMGCLGDGSTETFNLIGEGFTSFPENKNPTEYSRKYINHKTEQSDVIGYAPSIEYSADCISDDPVVKEIVKIHESEAVGNDTHRNIVSVNLWEANTAENTYSATMRTYAIIPGTKGDGTDALIYTGTMKAVGDVVAGAFNTSTKKFTASTDSSTDSSEST